MKVAIEKLLKMNPFLSKKGSLVFKGDVVTLEKTINDILEDSNISLQCFVPDRHGDIVTLKNISANAENIHSALSGTTSAKENQEYIDGLDLMK